MKLSHAHGPSTPPLLDQTIGENLRQTVDRFGDRDALVVRHQNYRATYRDLWDATTTAARGLMTLGVRKGERVGVWAPNRWEWVVLQYATARIGAILVNVNPSYQAFELQYALNQSGVSVLFLARGFKKCDYIATLAAVRDQCPNLRLSSVIDDEWGRLAAASPGTSADDLAAREQSLTPGEAINIQYTSGTTGFPKGATLSHTNILNNAYLTGAAIAYSERDRVCIPVPFYHCFGMVLGNLACTSHGSCMVVPSEAFDPLSVLECVAAEKCTSLYGVPTMFIAELDHPRFAEFDLSSLRTGIMAGAPCPIELMKNVVTKMHMHQVAIGYGMTETSPISTMTSLDDPIERRVGTVGRVIPHVEIKIVNPAGDTVPSGEAGEFCTRGSSVMLGYWNDPAATKNSIDADGWMHSGDLATMDDAGYVNIVGRIKDMIIRGGENIYPREIEEFLHTHPAVSEAQVIGVPSVKYGEEVMAWIKVRPGMSLTEGELTRFCEGQIARFKTPRFWKVVEAFPMTVTGKVQKFRMREIAIADLGLDEAARLKTA